MPSKAIVYIKIYTLQTRKKLLFLKNTISATTLAFTSIIIAIFSLKTSIDQLNASNSTSAKGIYKDYLTLAMGKPKYAGASYPLWKPRYSQFVYGSDQREGYEYFVSLLLHSVDEILKTSAKRHWENTLTTQLTYHALYLSSEEFDPTIYICETRELIANAIEQYADIQYKYSSSLNPIKLNNEKILCTTEEQEEQEEQNND